jgi:hypothetical protein
VQRDKGQLKLRLDACGAEDTHSGGVRDGFIEQRGLADPWRAAQNQYAAGSGACALEQFGDLGPFGVPSVKHQIRSLEVVCAAGRSGTGHDG